MSNELDDVLHASNKYIEAILSDEDGQNGISRLRMKVAIEKVDGIMPYPIMLDGKPKSGTELVADALTLYFAEKAADNVLAGGDPFNGLREHIEAAITIGTMMGYEIGVAMTQQEEPGNEIDNADTSEKRDGRDWKNEWKPLG